MRRNITVSYVGSNQVNKDTLEVQKVLTPIIGDYRWKETKIKDRMVELPGCMVISKELVEVREVTVEMEDLELIMNGTAKEEKVLYSKENSVPDSSAASGSNEGEKYE